MCHGKNVLQKFNIHLKQTVLVYLLRLVLATKMCHTMVHQSAHPLNNLLHTIIHSGLPYNTYFFLLLGVILSIPTSQSHFQAVTPHLFYIYMTEVKYIQLTGASFPL